MFFTDLPSEVVHWALSQPGVSDQKVTTFLYCQNTYHAAQHRLISDREMYIKCQENVVLLENQYGFGLYGLVPAEDSHVIKCDLADCVGSTAIRRVSNMVRLSRALTINVCFDDSNTSELIQSLGRLSLLLEGTGTKNLLLQVTANHLNVKLSESIVALLVRLTHMPNLTLAMQLQTHQQNLPMFASAAAFMELEWLNIRCEGPNEVLAEQFDFTVHEKLRKLKLSCNFLVPMMSFASGMSSSLTHLELDLPIDSQAIWVKNGHLLQFTELEDLRLFTLDEFACLRYMFGNGFLQKLESLYISFGGIVESYADFSFERLAPTLGYLYLSDKKATTTKRSYH